MVHSFFNPLARSRYFFSLSFNFTLLLFLLLFYTFERFSHQRLLMVFHWGLTNCKSSQIPELFSVFWPISSQYPSRVWIVSTRPLISKSSSSCINHLTTVPRAPITIGISITFMVHSFFNSLARFRYLSFFFVFFQFYSVISWTAKPIIRQILFFCWLLQGLVVWPWLDDSFVFQGPEEFLRLILQDRCKIVHIPFVRMVVFKFLAQFPVDHISTQVVSSHILFLG